jgi:hypothetical protein
LLLVNEHVVSDVPSALRNVAVTDGDGTATLGVKARSVSASP